MGIAGAISALSYVALAGAVIWVIMLIRKSGEYKQLIADLEDAVRIKDEQLKAATRKPRNKRDAADRLRKQGKL
jgi:hypothetical protein